MVSKNLVYLGTFDGAILKLELSGKNKVENIQSIYGILGLTQRRATVCSL